MLFGIVLLMLILMLLVLGLTVFIIVFWMWMLVDCLQRKKFNDKLVWVIVLIALNVIGAVLYYFIAKEEKRNKRK
ncbi:MAG: PLDc_N domain-containing protein [Candidatus Aenigmarchaeota archaeon]|nr:PLDc_N domain-containing protein [Candidatus Aenigmarchaeota archaeon]